MQNPILKYISRLFLPETVKVQLSESGSKELPARGGERRSVPNTSGVADIMLGINYEQIYNEIPNNIYILLDNLSKYDPDFSKAIENICELSNRPHDITITDGDITDDESTEIIKELRSESMYWYDNSAGITSLKNDLLSQIVRTGALSAEIVIRPDLSGIKEVVLVPTRTIVFKYEKEYQSYYPYQDIHRLSGAISTQAPGGLIELNPETYHYHAIRRIDENPYAIPPLLTAIQNILKEDKMLNGLDKVIDRFGLLGFLAIGVTPPKQRHGESETAYYDRTKKYLEKLKPEIENGLDKGYVLGFNDHHKFELAANNVNANGFADLFRLNTELKHSGLKQNPFLLGRNYSTTEAMANIIFEQLLASITKYQTTVDTFLAKCFVLQANLMGYPIKSIEVKSHEPKLKDELKVQEIFSKKIQNAEVLYNSGVISQTQKAQMLGYDEPDMEAPRTNNNQNNTNNNADDNDNNADEETNSKSNNLMFDYGHVHGTSSEMLNSLEDTKFGKLIAKYIELYLSEINNKYSESLDDIILTIGEKLLSLTEYATEQQAIDLVVSEFRVIWPELFTKNNQAVIDKWVVEAYKAFRKDVTMFEGLDEIPKSTFNLFDYRAMDYHAQSDKFYLGKFINDPDTNKKITLYIKENYLNGTLPIGRNSNALDKFRNEFKDVLVGEDYKIERIISTTVNKMRNTAAVNSMYEAGVTQYEIVGVKDRLQCPYCRAMQGKTFSVVKEKERLNSYIASDPTKAEVSPFLTSVFRKNRGESLEDFEERIRMMDAAEFENNNVAAPPYHPFCRDVAVAVIK